MEGNHIAQIFPKISHQIITSKRAKKSTSIIALQNLTKNSAIFAIIPIFCHYFRWFLLFRHKLHFGKTLKMFWQLLRHNYNL